MAHRKAKVVGDIAYIPLPSGEVAMVDACDLIRVSGYSWHAMPKNRGLIYAKRWLGPGCAKTTLLMHHCILSPPKGMVVDHADGNGLNNRRSNLRLASVAQNCQNSRKPITNTSGYKGVTFHKHTQKFDATINAFGKVYHLGYFDDPEEAHAAYCKAATRLHKEFANFGERTRENVLLRPRM